ncbi:MAG TPA: CoA transferase [Deltaproteobacteria bacterium]|nr:CoA transferase [Deltaproteobacteria bacterium]
MMCCLSRKGPLMSAPLEGITVLDLTWNLPGPYASFLLASLGATVTKIEPPGGEPARHMPTLFEAINRGKDSVVLDLKQPGDRERLLQQVGHADVFIEGFRPGVADRLGCGAPIVQAHNPRIVYCSISAFGQRGPRRDQPGHDLNAQALAGLCHLARDPSGRPHGLPIPVADLSASMSAVASICAALYARDRGESDRPGALLDVAMVDTALSWASIWSDGVDLAASARRAIPPGMDPLARRLLLERLDRQRLHALPHYEVFRCRDGAWLAIGVVDERHFWTSLCEALGLRRLSGLSMSARTVLSPVIKRLFALSLRRRPRDTWLERFEAEGLPVCAVLTPAEARADPHLRGRLVDPRGRLRAPVAGGIGLSHDAPPLSGDGGVS